MFHLNQIGEERRGEEVDRKEMTPATIKAVSSLLPTSIPSIGVSLPSQYFEAGFFSAAVARDVLQVSHEAGNRTVQIDPRFKCFDSRSNRVAAG